MRSLIILFIFTFGFLTGGDLFAQDAENVEQVNVITDQWDIVFDVVVIDDLAYVADNLNGLQLIDISDPENPDSIGNCDTPSNAYSIWVLGEYAYIADGFSGLQIIDISDSANSFQVGEFDTPGYAIDVFVSGDYAYIADDRDGGIQIINISNPERPFRAGQYNTGNAHGVSVSDDYAYVADNYNGLLIFDISDLESLNRVGRYNELSLAADITISGDYVYIADGEFGGIKIINISNPANPHLVGEYDTPGQAEDITISGDHAYVADRSGGIRIVNIADPENPIEVGYYHTPGSAHGVHVADDGLIYVADWTNLGIYRFNDPEFVNDPNFSNPQEFHLFPAYPNPFNSSTTITYRLPHPGTLALKVYNQLGQRISILFEGHRHAGFYTAEFSSKDIPTGLYFIQLETSGQALTKKVTLIK